MFVSGMYIQLLQDLKTISKDFNISIGDMFQLAPFEMELMSMMIKKDLAIEQEKMT